MQLPIIPIILSVIVIGLGIFIFLPSAFAQFVESDGSQTSLSNAVVLDTDTSEVFFETLRFDQRHFYTFDAAQGETVSFSIIIPKISGLDNYMPTIAFYKLGDDKEFIRFSPPMFFGEIPGERQIVTFGIGSGNWFQNQRVTMIIDETGTYVIEVFNEGNCLVRLDSTVEKRCDVLVENPTEFFPVIEGKYGLIFGNVRSFDFITHIQSHVFFEDPLGNLISAIFGGVIETGGSPENIRTDDLRWIIIISLIIIAVIIIIKRDSLRGKI